MDGDPRRYGRALRRWGFAAVPVLALLELGAGFVQARSAPPPRDWSAARDYVAAHVAPDDLVAFAPRWVDPIGRETFGPRLASLEREARADESRFPRAFEVSVRGAHLPAFAGWRRTDERRFGRVTVTTWENPAPEPVLDDLVSLFESAPDRVSVSLVRGGREVACEAVNGASESGGLGFGPAIPGHRFVCPGGSFVGASVVADLDYVPHRCLYAPPNDAGALRIRFRDVRFGRALRGHHALYVEAERNRRGAPVTIAFSAAGAPLGSVVHRDGDGWKPFELPTPDVAGRRGDLVVDVASSGERRAYCFEASTSP